MEDAIELILSSDRHGERKSFQIAKGPRKPSCERANRIDGWNARRILPPCNAKADDLGVFHSELCDVHGWAYPNDTVGIMLA
jgi:hypothetical protein